MTLHAADFSLATHGAEFLPGLASGALPELQAAAARYPSGKAGIRIVGDLQLSTLVGAEGFVTHALNSITGQAVRPVRMVLFDKSDAANWALGWHQDRTIAVQQRCDLPGYGPWTTKQGIQHVEPPFDITRSMVTVRIHLDCVDENNAPLLIALGSHLAGWITVERVSEAVEASESFACLAEPGDVWIYSTPILHASRAAASGRRRRVLQVDYTARTLPDGLEWLGI